MADRENENKKDGNNALLPWYDYRPGKRVPHHVTHLRMGVKEAVEAAQNGSTPKLINVSSPCYQYRPKIQQLQIHVHTVQGLLDTEFFYCGHLTQVEFVTTTTTEQSMTATAAMAGGDDASIQPRFATIGYENFRECFKLHSVIGLEHVSCSLERIGECAFWQCEKLTRFNLSCLTRLQSLGDSAFYQCESLVAVDLSKCLLLETVGRGAFGWCKALTTIHLPPKLKRLNQSFVQGCSALVSIVLPTSVEFMGYVACAHCTSLTRVTFQSTLHLRSLMHQQQFRGCTSLHTLELQQGRCPIARKLWPRLLEQFLREGNGILARAGIPNMDDKVDSDDEDSDDEEGDETKNQRTTIAWNFLRANIANFYVEEKKAALGRKRDAHSSVDNG